MTFPFQVLQTNPQHLQIFDIQAYQKFAIRGRAGFFAAFSTVLPAAACRRPPSRRHHDSQLPGAVGPITVVAGSATFVLDCTGAVDRDAAG
tara:strand:+ start:15540 stop:15812 length:273 start_codon:yes stop_codon:yes gene_type:complete